ncbi:MAG TPA: UDP-N-acetylmuramate dehydrogenase [Bryobacteraceae bacterium]|jgi:UDP-N-acetylmuramate dehydrogenase
MLSRLRAISHLQVQENAPLSRHTRFALGGPARILADASTETALAEALAVVRNAGVRLALIGGGSNLVVADEGFPGVVLRYTARGIEAAGTEIHVESGAVLQDLVDLSIERGLRGLDTMTGIPGWVGGAIYGNAGAYGHSIEERVERVRFFDGSEFREFDRAGCEFRYRESIFKRHKDWIVTSATLKMDRAEAGELRASADAILKIRNEKYPPTLRCAGSIFKNLILAELPESVRARVPERVVREGKVPSAYFLEQAGAKGMVNGGIRVADYHSNLIYNADSGTAGQVRATIDALKRRVHDLYGLDLEEEVQYIG